MVDFGKILWNLAVGTGALGGLAIGLLYMFQEKLIYIPRVPGMPSDYAYYPDYFGLAYEDIWLTTSDNVHLNAWLMWPRNWTREQRAQRPIVIFYQENAGNMSYRLPFLRSLVRFLNCNALIVSYRGYGRSQGTPTEEGLKLDAQACLDHILSRTDVDTSNVVLMGRSLGAAVAIHTAAANKQNITGLIIENTFESILNVVPDVMPLLGFAIGPGRPMNFLLRNKWWNNKELKHLTDTPTLFLSSLDDEMIPASHMRRLYNIWGKEPWILVPFPGARHIDAYETHAASYWPVVKEFVVNVTEGRSGTGNGGAAAVAAGVDVVAPKQQVMSEYPVAPLETHKPGVGAVDGNDKKHH